ncbi:MAG: type II toxin-antitoxin system HicB family antitoxin [bacterium]|nr:type II toxin-antitoxin system HicB family antitoxin [bacterium]
MKNIIQFTISKEDGFYTASGVNAPIVTQGKTFEELTANIREAVLLFFEGENPAELGFGATPSILTNFELSLPLYGVNA